MAALKGSRVSNNKIVIWLLSATIIYQVLYQGVMLYMLEGDEGSDAQCEGEAAGSPRCAEMNMFRTWRNAELAGMAKLADQGHYENFESSEYYLQNLAQLADKRTSNITPFASDSPWIQKQLVVPVMTTTTIATAREPHVEVAQLSQGKILVDASSSTSNASWSPITAWGRELQAIQGKFEARMERLPSVRRARQAERKAKFDELYNSALAAIHNRSNVSDWAQDLTALQERLQARAENLEKKHRQHQQHNKVAVENMSTGSSNASLLDQIYAFGRELCEDEHRRKRNACAMFLQGYEAAEGTRRHQRSNFSALKDATAQFETRMAELQAASHEWSQQFENNVSQYMLELCSDPARKDYSACANHKPSTSVAPKSSLRGFLAPKSALSAYEQRLKWSSVPAWSDKRRVMDRHEHVSFGHDDLKHQKWQGRIPKVSCIAAVPPGRDTHARMKYFLNNFRLQSYEGARELVLVYRWNDTDIAQLVQDNADGVFIKAVASRDSHIPSTTAYRYAAWSSDADVIARWDFDTWHHPDRLSMQVRALALAARPVSILSHWTVLSSDKTGDKIESANPGLEGSLVGQAKWMQEHWMPILEAEQRMLSGVQAHWIAQVNMPALSVHHAPVHPHAERASAEARLATVCTLDSRQAASVSIEPTRAELNAVYNHLLTRKAEVDNSLAALCAEAAGEKDTHKLEGLVEHIEDIAAAQHEIKEHIVAVDALDEIA